MKTPLTIFALVCLCLSAFGESKEIEELRKKAEAGDASAQFSLGVMYLKGEGVLRDFASAYAWCNLAAFNGNAGAAKSRDLIAKLMPPEQIDKAQDLYKELLKKIEAKE
jgi:hypothetical protein